MSKRVPFVGAVALTVWQIFQYCRDRVAFGVVRQPDAGSERRAVFERDQCMLDNTRRTWEGGDNHRNTPLTRNLRKVRRNHARVKIANPCRLKQQRWAFLDRGNDREVCEAPAGPNLVAVDKSRVQIVWRVRNCRTGKSSARLK